MLNWKEILEQYIERYSDEIGKVTKPLRERFGIEYFTYHRIDDKGNHTVLVDRPDWAERYVADKLFLQDPYLREPSVYQSGICPWSSYGDEEFQQTVKQAAKETLSSDTTIIVIEKEKNPVEFLGFAASNKSHLASIAFNHPSLLRAFGAHFKKQLSPILSQMGEEPGFLPELKGEDYYIGSPIVPELDKKANLAFLADLGLQKELEQIFQLSSREKECLHFLVKGKTAKETAALLGLSPRTVESYLDHIKTKWGCWSKQELFEIASHLTVLNLLP